MIISIDAEKIYESDIRNVKALEIPLIFLLEVKS